jgi:hypothetical protein
MSLRPNHNKAKEQEAVERHKRAFMEKGGIIEVLPPMEFTYRLHTVNVSGGEGGDLMLYASRRDAITGKREDRKLRRGGGY